jgi:hypothetical protein
VAAAPPLGGITELSARTLVLDGEGRAASLA